jgi:hypothetical protein
MKCFIYIYNRLSQSILIGFHYSELLPYAGYGENLY